MKLNEFYEKALSTLSLSVDDDGYVVIKDEESTNRVTVGKKFLVMATSNHVSTMDDNKVLFNPLQEDSIKGINPSMVKYKALIERKLSVSFNVAQKLLAKLASDMKLQKDASLELNNKFIAKFNKIRSHVDGQVFFGFIQIFGRSHQIEFSGFDIVRNLESVKHRHGCLQVERGVGRVLINNHTRFGWRTAKVEVLSQTGIQVGQPAVLAGTEVYFFAFLILYLLFKIDVVLGGVVYTLLERPFLSWFLCLRTPA
jgi:hypothetical protein